ncbi:GAP family protein [Streptomyces sp. SID5469]|nr:GAP family protein [Streptomyces sp. SID5469]
MPVRLGRLSPSGGRYMGKVLGDVGGSEGASGHGQPATWVGGGLKLGLGVLLALFGVRLWHRRPRDVSQARLPKWMAAIDSFTPVKIFGLALLLSAANIKNATFTIAASASISSSGIPLGQQIGALAVFVVIASLGILAPLAVFLIAGERARNTLDGWKNWAAQHNIPVMAVLCFVIGLKLLGDGIAILTG